MTASSPTAKAARIPQEDNLEAGDGSVHAHEKPMKQVTYRCTKCKCTDVAMFMPHEAVMPAIHCAKCKAGQGKSLEGMLETRIGMFPEKTEIVDLNKM